MGSCLIGRSMRDRLHALLVQKEFDFLRSDDLLNELSEVAMRPKFRKYVSESDARKFIKIIEERLEIIVPKSKISLCRDPDDDDLLAICKDAKADFLITGDHDLLVLNPFESTRIIGLAEFEHLLKN